MEDPPLRKADVPFLYHSVLIRALSLIGVASMLYGAFADPGFREARPGVLDGTLGAVAALLLIKALSGWLAAGWKRQMLRIRGERLWFLISAFDFAPPVAGLGSVLVSAAAWAALWYLLGLRWPWCGIQPSMLPGFLAGYLGMVFVYAHCYDRLPD